jgi:hypothetical protein
VSPGLFLAALIVLIGAQCAALLSPGRRYPVALVLAAAGFAGGELFALATHLGGPVLGGLHPVAGAAGIAVAESGGALLAPARRAP